MGGGRSHGVRACPHGRGTSPQSPHLLERLNETVGSDDVLNVLQQAGLCWCGALGLHHGDLLDFALQDEEPVVRQVDAMRGQLLTHVLPGRALVVDAVDRLGCPLGAILAGTLLAAAHLACYHELGALDDAVRAVGQIDDPREEDGHLIEAHAYARVS